MNLGYDQIIKIAYLNERRFSFILAAVALLISFFISMFLYFVYSEYNIKKDAGELSHSLDVTVSKMDYIFKTAEQTAYFSARNYNSCDGNRVNILQKKVQRDPYVRSITFFDRGGNVVCSTSTRNAIILNSDLSEGVRVPVNKILSEHSKELSLSMIKGTLQLPDRPSLVIYIPLVNGIVAAVIDGRIISDFLNPDDGTEDRYRYLMVGKRILSSSNTLSDYSLLVKDNQLTSQKYPYAVVIKALVREYGYGNRTLKLLTVLFGFFVIFTGTLIFLKRAFSQREFLINALKNGRLSADAQPLITLHEKRVVGLEILVRWRLIDGIQIPTSVFIPVAEEKNVVDDIGEYLIKKVADQIRVGTLFLPDGFKISFNIHPGHLEKQSLIRACKYFIEATEDRNIKLVLEMTERGDLEKSVNVVRSLSELNALGVCIAVDDFGTGSSGLKYLYDDIFDCIKVDRFLIEEAIVNERACAVLKASLVLAQDFGKTVVIEGIENESQITLLKKIAMQKDIIIQGFLWGKPMRTEQFNAWFEEYNS